MSGWTHYGETSDVDAGDSSLFGQTMSLVAVTTGVFTLGAYLGRNLSANLGFVFFIGAFACLIGMRFAVRQSGSSAMVLLLVFGALMGLSSAPTLVYYADTNPEALWQAGGATALFMLGLGAAGYASRRDLSGIGRASFWALLALILFGVVTIFVNAPNAERIYSVAGLVIFAGLVAFDFSGSGDLAASTMLP